MATGRDLELARRLLAAGVLTEEEIRGALALQAQWLQKGHVADLPAAVYARGLLPRGSLALVRAPPPTESQPLTNYRLHHAVGEGGMSVVYAGTYVPNDTPVAVKVLDPVKALRDVHRERFFHEANLHIEIEHENIVAGYEVGTEGGYHFYTMDLVDGVTVQEVIERRGYLENHEALSITLQLARALECLHDRQLIHRDTKPGNAMVEATGRTRLIDLGLVRRPEEATTEAQTLTAGTVEYLAPEQARGAGDLDGRADIYSLGISLYHMVVGEVPFQGETDYEVMAKQVLAAVDAQKIKQRRIEPEIYYLIAKMAAKEREERYGTVREAMRVIEGYLPDGIVPVDLGESSGAAAGDVAGKPPVVQPVVPPRRGRGRRGPPRRRRHRERGS